MIEKLDAIIMDIDYCLSDNNYNERHNLSPLYDNLQGFKDNIKKLKVNNWAKEIMRTFPNHYKLIITAREGTKNVINDTLYWLNNNNIPFDDIFFRKEFDNRNDDLIKKEIYLTKIEPKYNVLFGVDDNELVTQVLQNLGVKMLYAKR